MTRLLSSPETTAAWNWEIETESDGENGNLGRGARAALSMAEILKKHGLLDLSQMMVSWHRAGVGPIGFRSLISMHEGASTSPDDLVQMISASRPAGYTDALAGQLELLGPGVWINNEGHTKREQKLIGAFLSMDEFAVWGTLWVMHDIWSYYDFSGQPHPEVYNNNAPRLASVLKEIETSLDVEIEEGEPTYFATPEKYGILTPTTEAEGLGFDATDRL
ncbi:hypothetical protein SAMN05421803_101603 [Nocardiopsis flavescens]|uniref:Uncharacterized protein n=1 Tax=Nocardiopsis flavescens TaxID=758803 RepID=A0A1M6C6V1_9ACTN|nr:hypothetical protein SAMN05421803_101603 [Nocardiopsis flavescens]